MVRLDGADKLRVHDIAGAKDAHPAGQGQHPVRHGMALHRQAPLREPHFQPGTDPARAIAHHLFVGGKGLQIGVGAEHRQGFFHDIGAKDRIAVHEDHQIIRVHAPPRHAAQDQPDGHALAGLVLAHKGQIHQSGRQIGAVRFDIVAHDHLVIRRPGPDPERDGNLFVPDLLQNRADHRAGDGRFLVIGRHLDMDPARPPARRPKRTGRTAHRRPFQTTVILGAHRMG